MPSNTRRGRLDGHHSVRKLISEIKTTTSCRNNKEHDLRPLAGRCLGELLGSFQQRFARSLNPESHRPTFKILFQNCIDAGIALNWDAFHAVQDGKDASVQVAISLTAQFHKA